MKRHGAKGKGVKDQDPGTAKTGPARLGLAGRLRNYFFAGILVTAPVGITFWLTWKIIAFVDDQITPLIPPKWTPEHYLPFALPGFGLVVAVIVLTLIGVLAAGYLGRLVKQLVERVVTNVPVARSIYAWVKQIFETMLSQKTTAFHDVVLVEYPCRGVWAVGFITGQTEGEVQNLTGETVFNVFVPATPNPTTGFLLFIPERDIHRLAMSVEEGIKLVISGGIILPPEAGRAGPPGGAAPSDGEPDTDPGGHRLGILRRLRNYFFAGVLVTAPIGITVLLAWEIVALIDDWVTPFIPPAWDPETYLPFSIPGLGVAAIVIVLTLVGFLTAGLVGRTLLSLGESLLDRMPVVRSLYSAVKQIVQVVFKQQSRAFREVVLIQYPRAESWAIGFITGEPARQIQEVPPPDVINIFLPTTPNPTSGFLLFVPREEVQTLSMTVEEGIKMVISGGIVTPPDRRPRPAASTPDPEDSPPEDSPEDSEVATTA